MTCFAVFWLHACRCGMHVAMLMNCGALQSLCLFEHKDNRMLHHAHIHFLELLLGAHISETVAAKARFTIIMTIAHLSIDD